MSSTGRTTESSNLLARNDLEKESPMGYLNLHTHQLDTPLAGAATLDQDVQRTDATGGVLYEVARERSRQDAKWGEQNHPDGTGRPGDGFQAEMAREICKANGPGEDNWRDILTEEVHEAYAETDPAKLRAELIQVAAVAVNWIEAIDRRAQP